MMPNQEVEKEEKESRWQWFLFIIVIPALFAAALAFVIMAIAGVDPVDAAKTYSRNIPIISQWIDVQKIEKKLEATIEKQNATIASQKKRIRHLENELSTKQQEVDQLKQTLERLQKQQSAPVQSAKTEVIQNKAMTMDDVVNMYKTMSEKNAAAILANMSESDVLTILSALDSGKAAAILEKMPPDQAAKYTSMLERRAEENQLVEGAAQ
jgi:flagellar protein FlbB